MRTIALILLVLLAIPLWPAPAAGEEPATRATTDRPKTLRMPDEESLSRRAHAARAVVVVARPPSPREHRRSRAIVITVVVVALVAGAVYASHHVLDNIDWGDRFPPVVGS